MNGKGNAMLGQKARSFKTHPSLCLEDLVPENHFYRQLEAKLDLSFVREWVREAYASTLGRPSIDPVVFFKLQLIMFFDGIRSERQLLSSVTVNLAQRWYIGYDLDEAVPNHSSLSKIRERYGLEIFERFFEKVVELCIAAGLVEGRELYFDGTKVRANADADQQVPRFYWQAQEHLRAVFASDKGSVSEEGMPALDSPASPPLVLNAGEGPERIGEVAASSRVSQPARPRDLLDTYDGQRLVNTDQSTRERQADIWVCPTDPDASPLRPGKDGSGRLGYHDHYVVDGGKARIILAVLVTPASVGDNAPMLDMERWARFRWRLQPKIGVGDTRYGTVVNLVGLEQDGIRAYLALPKLSQRSKVFPPDKFRYDLEQDVYVCPQGKVLKHNSYNKQKQSQVYEASVKDCRECPLKAQCTTSRFRRLYRSDFQDVLSKVQAYHTTPAYKTALGKRSVWIEPLFGEAKQWHHLMIFRLRGLRKVNIEALLTAAGQNLKRLLNPARYLPVPLPPAASLALAVPAPATAGVPDLTLLLPLGLFNPGGYLAN